MAQACSLVKRVRDGRAEIYGKQEGFSANYVVDFVEDPDGNLWLGTFDAGLACLRRTAVSGFGAREGLPTDDVQTILQARDGTIWIGTNAGGLAGIAARRAAADDGGRLAARVWTTLRIELTFSPMSRSSFTRTHTSGSDTRPQ